MVPKKVWVIVKISALLTIFLLVQTTFKQFAAITREARQHSNVQYYPIASLYRKDIQPIIARQCRNHVTIHNHVIVEFANITLDPSKAHASGRGGAKLTETVTQRESDEIFSVKQGFLTLPCQDNDLNLNGRMLRDLNEHVEQWRDSIIINNQNNERNLDRQRGLTVIIERNEYANVYWTLMDLYDVFISMRYLNHTFRDTHIILADARPVGHLDGLWKSFATVKRLQDIESPLLFDKLTWRFDRVNSPFLSESLRNVPLIDEFRKFVMTSQGISISVPTSKPTECSNLRILFIWRHDYVAHPRNPQGAISRKISNEAQLLNATRAAFPQHTIDGTQLDRYDIGAQLMTVASCDVMVGMHGAAMAYSTLLPPGGAVIELFPFYYGYPNWHMKKLAKWSHHGYFKFMLPSDLDDVAQQTTTVPQEIAIEAIQKATKFVCAHRNNDPSTPQSIKQS